ncbi:hypothetical protein [Desulfolucanica intricata]|uniref:hypothetical protein n=1 Tax=Desulfolucanica intricata TaxID=1285191 RepID=UPI00083700E7|nr:hypothetical protein [Desulfolucanica intricata]
MDSVYLKGIINNLKVSKQDGEIRPHKYLLLLSILDLLEVNNNHENKFTFEELEPVFLSIFDRFFPNLPDYRKMLEFPFYHLQSDGFWFLKVKEGKKELYETYKKKSRLTKKRIMETVDYACLGEKLFQLMSKKDNRQIFRGQIENIINSLRGVKCVLGNNKDLIKDSSSLCDHENPTIVNIDINNRDVSKIPDKQGNYLTDHMNEWLIKAVAIKSNERFATVQEMRTSFTSGGLAKKDTAVALGVTAPAPKHNKAATLPGDNVLDLVMNNPFVFYLNTLSNASANNENATAESQIGHPFFRKIAVKSPLVKFIHEKLAGEKCNIILTGNAGDGKTTIAVDIYAAISGKECTQLNKIEDLGRLVIVKDMSELSDVERTRVLSEAVRDKEKNYLIVSNTGTLLESYKRLNVNGQRASASELLGALEADTPQSIFNAGYLIINIGRMDSIDTAVNVFKRMLETVNWEKCSECKYSEECPILTNVRLLQDTLNTVCERITMLYRRLYEYNIRLTMRQMTGHLAYAITAGLNCNEIANLSLIARQEMVFDTLFFNRFFGDNGKDVHNEALQLQPIRQIRKVDFGAVLHPGFERITWIGDENTHSLRGYPLTILQKLNDKYDKNNPNYRQQVRRLIYFLKDREHGDMDNYIHVFLHSPMLVNFLEFTGDLEKIPPLLENKYRARIMHVLQEYFSGVRLPEEVWQASDLYITLNRRFVGSGTQMVLANFRIEDFKLIIKPRYKVLGSSRGILSLKYMPGEIEMDLDLPFLDYVERRYQGEVAEELSAYYANRIEQFKVRLLNYYLSKNMVDNQDLRILRLDSNRAFKVMRIIISENGLEVIS